MHHYLLFVSLIVIVHRKFGLTFFSLPLNFVLFGKMFNENVIIYVHVNEHLSITFQIEYAQTHTQIAINTMDLI